MYPYLLLYNIEIPVYGLCMALGILVVSTISAIKMRNSGGMIENVIIVSAITVGFALIGAKLFYVMASYSIYEIFSLMKGMEFKFLFEGGFVFYGGLIFGILGAYIGGILAKCSLKNLESVIVTYITIGHAIGRIGCLFAGCCYGVEYSGIGAIYYKNTIYNMNESVGHFPVQVVEAVGNVAITVILVIYARKARKLFDITILYLVFYSAMRFCLEFLRGDLIRGRAGAFSTSQWIAIFIFAGCIGFTSIRTIKFRPRCIEAVDQTGCKSRIHGGILRKNTTVEK